MASKNGNEEGKKPEAALVANVNGVEDKTSQGFEKEGSQIPKDQNGSSFNDKPARQDKKESRLEITEVLNEGLGLRKKTSKLNKVFSFIQNNSVTLRNLVVAAATYGLERVFNCPESNNGLYGFAFLFAPVIILFCTNLLVIGEIWKLSSRMYVKRYRRRGDCIARVLPSVLKACVGPAVWLIAAFLEEDYYLCAKLGPFYQLDSETSEQEIFEWKKKVEECKSQSHILAWSVLVALVILGTAVIVWKYCYLKDNLLTDNLYAYERREALSAMKAFIEHMGASCKDADLHGDPKTAEYGREEEMVTLYDDGVPEMIGKKTVERLFEDVFRSGFWDFDQNVLPDGPVSGLTDRLKVTVLSSKANSTSLLYHRAYRKWKEFAISMFNGNVFPANPFHVALYLQHLIEQSQSPSVVDSAFYGIKWAHSMAGIPSPTDNPIVEAVRSASKRILGTGVVNRKEPVSSSLIHDIIGRSNLDNPVELRNITMYVLSFAGFFRFDDVSRIRRNDIFFNDGFMVIKIHKSKNDQLRRGDEVVISELSSCACPVKLLRRYLANFQISPESRELIFRPISRGKGACRLVAPDKPISYTTIREAFRRDLKSIGADPSRFGLHSLRSGGATMAANNGVNDRVFQRHGRWKSVQAKDIYVDDDLEQRLAVSKFLGL